MKLGVAPVNDPGDDESDAQATAALIEKVRAAGHQVRQDRDGGFLVTKWGMTRHCLDAESLQTFAKQVGAA